MNGLLKERGGLPTALKIAKLPTSYHFSLFPQVFSRRRAAINRCVSCDSRVTNGNVGGNKRAALVSAVRGLSGTTSARAWMCGMKADISEAKRKVPLPALLHRLGLGQQAKKSARCPFHNDKHNSFSVWRNGRGCGFGNAMRVVAKGMKSPFWKSITTSLIEKR